jgi:hypothetical protein
MYATVEPTASASAGVIGLCSDKYFLSSMPKDYHLVIDKATSFGNLPKGIFGDTLASMDINEIRRKNLLLLIEERFGTIAKLAENIDKQAGYVSRMLGGKEEHRRSIGEKMARAIEEKLALPNLWLDQQQTQAHHSQPDIEIKNSDGSIIVIEAKYRTGAIDNDYLIEHIIALKDALAKGAIQTDYLKAQTDAIKALANQTIDQPTPETAPERPQTGELDTAEDFLKGQMLEKSPAKKQV